MFKKLVIISGCMATVAFATEQFGRPGSDGQSAQPGRTGSSPGTIAWDVDGSSRSFDLQGEDGTDARGRAENGAAAYSCHQQTDRPDHNLRGAPGGDGGDGASGGKGGHGGTVYFYLPSEVKLPLLKKVSVTNPGGQAGRSIERSRFAAAREPPNSAFQKVCR